MEPRHIKLLEKHSVSEFLFCLKILATWHWKGLDALGHPEEDSVRYLVTFIVQT